MTTNEMRLYRVTTTFPGADEPSRFYFDAKEKALNYLADCENGEFEKVVVTCEYSINYSDGCTLNDLCYGDFNSIKVDEI